MHLLFAECRSEKNLTLIWEMVLAGEEIKKDPLPRERVLF
jgi:hypothetical protein